MQKCILSQFMLLLVFLIGCGGSGGSSTVSGKVTYGGKNVGGMISFIGADKKVDAPITDGEYTINNAPLGNVKIAIVGMPDTSAPPGKDLKAKLPGETGADAKLKGGVAPPAKYASPDNGMTYEVKAGKHVHNIELK